MKPGPLQFCLGLIKTMNNKFTELEIDVCLTEAFIAFDRLAEARELLEGKPHVSMHWRGLALKYSDFDEEENAVYAFKRAYEEGDLKALPWLLELLKLYRPDDGSILGLSALQDKLFKEENYDIIFSLGNMQLMAGNFEETYRLWDSFLGKDLWIFERNVYANLLNSPDRTISIANREFGHLQTRQDLVLEVARFYLKHWRVEPDAFTSFISFLERETSPNDLKSLLGFDYEEVVRVARDYGEAGNAWPLLVLMSAVSLHQYINMDSLSKFWEESGLAKVFSDTGLLIQQVFPATTSISSQANFAGIANPRNPKHDGRLKEIFDRANVAQSQGDNAGELRAWIEGAKLGDSNCFYNIGISLGRDLGVVTNAFTGSSGGDQSAWGDLARGIQMDDIRSMENEVHYLNEFLLKTPIERFRQKAGRADGEIESNLKPGREANFAKLMDLLDFVGFRFFLLSERTLALPYNDGDGFLLTYVELVDDGEREFFMVHTPIMISRISDDSSFVPSETQLSNFEKKLLRIMIRSQHLIFPNMTLVLGDIFNAIPEGARPNIFINSMQANEMWCGLGQSADLLIDAIPTKTPFTQFNFGYAVDSSLTADHFDSAIRGALGAIIRVATTMNRMQQESGELFESLFEHDAVEQDQISRVGISASEQLELGLDIISVHEAIKRLRESNDFSIVKSLEARGVKLANRLVSLAQFDKNNVDFISEILLRTSKDYESDVELRLALNNLGWIYGEQNIDESKEITCYEASARLGCAYALSNISWKFMLQERFREAIEIYDKYYYRMMTTRETQEDFTQASNFRSNVALCRWAIGASKEELDGIWKDEYLQGSHAESLFYPILYTYLAGDKESARSQVNQLEKHTISDLVSTFEEGKLNSGWFGGISKSALEILPAKS